MKVKTKYLIPIFLLIANLSLLLAKQKDEVIEIYYFHATVRCESCLKIESYIHSTINQYFKKELESGRIRLHFLDFLQPENEFYSEKYNFDTQALIISKKVNGKELKWKNLEKIWDYLYDYKKFSRYIEQEVKKVSKS